MNLNKQTSVITGAGVQVKYTKIIDGRLKEIEKNPSINQSMSDFVKYVRKSTPEEFNQLYDLYAKG